MDFYYTVDSFSTLQFTQSLQCPFPPCINPLARPISQLGSVDLFESAASSVYHGATLSVRRRMNRGMYFRLAYTFARAIDDGQDALVAGRPATVQNAFLPSAERGPSVTDQRHRLALSWVAEPRPFHRGHDWLGHFFNDWKASGVTTVGSGRPVNATVSGDPNQDGNDSNDRLPGVRRNSFVGPGYATTDVRLSRRLYFGARLKLEIIGEWPPDAHWPALLLMLPVKDAAVARKMADALTSVELAGAAWARSARPSRRDGSRRRGRPARRSPPRARAGRRTRVRPRLSMAADSLRRRERAAAAPPQRL